MGTPTCFVLLLFSLGIASFQVTSVSLKTLTHIHQVQFPTKSHVDSQKNPSPIFRYASWARQTTRDVSGRTCCTCPPPTESIAPGTASRWARPDLHSWVFSCCRRPPKMVMVVLWFRRKPPRANWKPSKKVGVTTVVRPSVPRVSTSSGSRTGGGERSGGWGWGGAWEPSLNQE